MPRSIRGKPYCSTAKAAQLLAHIYAQRNHAIEIDRSDAVRNDATRFCDDGPSRNLGAAEDAGKFGPVKRLLLEKGVGQRVQRVQPVGEDGAGSFLGVFDEGTDRLVHARQRLAGEVLAAEVVTAQEYVGL